MDKKSIKTVQMLILKLIMVGNISHNEPVIINQSDEDLEESI